MHWLKDIGPGITSLFFPLICPGCGADLQRAGDQLCISCFNRLPITEFHRFAANPVEKIFWGRVPIRAACSFLYFTNHSIVQRLMHSLKYDGNSDVGIFFGRQMGLNFLHCDRFADLDAVVPLPLHPKREKKRGYNQAAMIARGIGEIMCIPVIENVVIRSTETQTQTRKNRIERWDNIHGKFSISKPPCLENKNLMLVDDVITTGATIESCAQTILNCTGTTLSIATLAYTLL